MYDVTFTDGHGFTATGSMRDPARTVTRLDGWYGGAPTDTEQIDRLTDGTVPAPLRRGPRKIVLGMAELLPDRAGTVRRQREISGAFMGVDTDRIGNGTLTVHNEEGTLTAHGLALDDTPRIAAYLGDNMIDWELALLAPDPRLYGPPQRALVSSPGIGVGLRYPLYQPGYLDYGTETLPPAAVHTNTGNATAYPLIQVQGNFPGGFRLGLTGDVPEGAGVDWAGAVTARMEVTVDMLAGQVRVGDTDQSWAITRAVWGGAAAHGGAVSATLEGLSGGTGYAAVELRSTYM